MTATAVRASAANDDRPALDLAIGEEVEVQYAGQKLRARRYSRIELGAICAPLPSV